MNNRSEASQPTGQHPSPASWILVAIAWTLVGIPLAWAVYRAFLTALKLF
jgi:hypothetical protein